MVNRIVLLAMLSLAIMHVFTYASHIQRIPRNGSSSADSSEKVAGGAVDSSTESAEQSLDLQLDEIKRNLTTGLPPEAAALIDGIVENVRNMSTDSLKTAGAKLIQLLFVPTIVEMAHNETVINALSTAFSNNDAVVAAEKTDNFI